MGGQGLISSNLLSLATRLYETKVGHDTPPKGGFVGFLQSHGIAGYLQAAGLIQDEGFKTLALRTAGFSFFCARVLEDIFTKFAERGVPALTFKGVGWSLLAYGNVLARPFGDLDLLIPRNRWTEARVALVECGYNPREIPGCSGQEAAFLRFSKCQEFTSMKRLPQLDLHVGLYSQWIAFEPSFEELWSRRVAVRLDSIGPLWTFGAEDAIVFTCLHSYQDGWAYLKGLLDLALLLERHSPEWSILANLARERTPMVAIAVAFAVHLLGAPAPRGWRSPVRDPEQTLKHYLEIMSCPEPVQLGLLSPNLWSGSKALALGRSVKAILTPSDDDLYSVKLPKFLVGFYPLVRVLRLLQKLVRRRKLK